MTEIEKKVDHRATLRRYGDTTDLSSKINIARLAFLLATLLIVLASASLIFIGRFASKAADTQAVTNQQLLLETALKGKFMLMARDQLSLARWDTSVHRISLRFDEDFIVDEFIDSLWFDFGLDKNLLIGPNNNILADSHEADVSFNTGMLSKESPLYRFVELARNQYFRNRINLSEGYGQQPVPFGKEFEHPIHGFVDLDGNVALIHAMAIVPDEGTFVLPDGNPVVLISAQFIESELVNELNDQLAFLDMQFEREHLSHDSVNQYTIISPNGKALGVFSWQGHLPGRHIWNTVIPVIILLGTILGIVAFIIAWKISRLTVSLAKSERQNLHLAMHDTLSGLGNRLKYNRALTVALEKLPSVPFTLIQCDLDKFKQVNDTLGHGAGDTVIKVVAQRLISVVGEAGLVCRIGGDEFVILLENVTRSAVEDMANMIIEEIGKPVDVGTEGFAQVGVSLGIATAPAHGDTAEKIMAIVDTTMYHAKEEGRNRAIFAQDLEDRTNITLCPTRMPIHSTEKD
ncbi:diguanylate cyclase (GGDEF) domain-containing protein [Desulfocapsa sulfexigens DSM 10523]|uniref:Diguanylate cyclase (GGDEF) domain-containing protein n=1 Tax=Desulfocapsa sulfexigens (strain DSM 10523 / SB164P1) TaxID=1167006 RepID=M1NDH6_DESSD|nr:diguanylate cyclase [Desulfocapsa sulfexigens]AGF77809.1 diguanylate cyclase (GGDEF) domain-containing protein [Desulfocapsa sulfexigens DSM 10523]